MKLRLTQPIADRTTHNGENPENLNKEWPAQLQDFFVDDH
jgi:hypothetical protein